MEYNRCKTLNVNTQSVFLRHVFIVKDVQCLILHLTEWSMSYRPVWCGCRCVRIQNRALTLYRRRKGTQLYLFIVFDLVFSAAAVGKDDGFPPNQSHAALLNLLRSQLVHLGRRWRDRRRDTTVNNYKKLRVEVLLPEIDRWQLSDHADKDLIKTFSCCQNNVKSMYCVFNAVRQSSG